MSTPQKFELRAVGECAFGNGSPISDSRFEAENYWRCHVATDPAFDPGLEFFVVLFLDRENRLLGHNILARGGSTYFVADTGAIVRAVILSGAASVIFMHNHPGAESRPSEMDMDTTAGLLVVAKLLGVQVVDHVILGEFDSYSFADAGLLATRDRLAEKQSAELELAHRSNLTMHFLLPDVELQRLVLDAAAQQGVPADEFVWDFTRSIFKHFLRSSLHEPRLALTLEFARDPAMQKLLFAAAERNRMGVCDYVWDVLLPVVKDFLAAKSAAPSTVAAL